MYQVQDEGRRTPMTGTVSGGAMRYLWFVWRCRRRAWVERHAFLLCYNVTVVSVQVLLKVAG